MHLLFLQQAIDLACENVSKGGGPFGAMIVNNQQIIAASGNGSVRILTPPLMPKSWRFAPPVKNWGASN